MRNRVFLVTITLLLLHPLPLRATAAVPPPKALRGGVEVRGTVVFTDGTRQRNVHGRCVKKSDYDAFYGPKAPSQFDSGILFGNEWHAGGDGTFRLSLTPGDYVMWAHGAKHRAVKLTVPKGRRSVAIKVIGRTNNIVAPLRFVTPEGDPLRNRQVHRGNAVQNGIVTDASGVGSFRFENYDPILPDRRFFWLKDVGFATVAIREQDLLAKYPTTVRFRKGAFVTGSVVANSTGKPLGGVVVFPLRTKNRLTKDEFAAWNDLFGADPYSTLRSTDEAAATSYDGNGSFTLGPLPPGDYNVLFSFPSAPQGSFRVKLERPMRVTEGVAPDSLNVEIPVDDDARELRGRALDGRTKTVIADEVITVSVQSYYPPDDDTYVEHWYIWEPVVRHVKTDKNGEFTLYPLDPGKLVFTASWKGVFVERRISVPSEEVVDFVVQPKSSEPSTPLEQRKRQ